MGGNGSRVSGVKRGNMPENSHPWHFQTPEWICQVMIRLMPEQAHYILEPTPGAGNLVRALMASGKSVSVRAPVEFWTVKGWFDAIIMNPPFSPMLRGYQILFRCMEMTDHIVALMPWLTLINSEKRTAAIKEWGLKAVHHLPRHAFPGSRVQCCILQMERGFQGTTTFHIVEK